MNFVSGTLKGNYRKASSQQVNQIILETERYFFMPRHVIRCAVVIIPLHLYSQCISITCIYIGWFCLCMFTWTCVCILDLIVISYKAMIFVLFNTSFCFYMQYKSALLNVKIYTFWIKLFYPSCANTYIPNTHCVVFLIFWIWIPIFIIDIQRGNFYECNFRLDIGSFFLALIVCQ